MKDLDIKTRVTLSEVHIKNLEEKVERLVESVPKLRYCPVCKKETPMLEYKALEYCFPHPFLGRPTWKDHGLCLMCGKYIVEQCEYVAWADGKEVDK